MKKQQFIQLIDKYVSGSATESEKALVEEYLKRMEAEGETELTDEQEQRQKGAMWLQIQQQTTKKSAKIIRPKWYQARLIKLSVAAVAACAVLVFFILRPGQDSFSSDNMKTIAVAEGEAIKKVKLADGTLVWIKPNSSLSFPETFTGKSREINLKGEALFEVAKDAARLFTVHCQNMDVQVLGTSFNIKDRKEKDTVEIAVLTGKVWVDPANQMSIEKVVLQPNDKLRFHKQSGWVSKGIVSSADAYTVGTAYDMHFVNTPIAQIAKRIEQKFDVTIKMDRQHTEDCNVSGNFTDQPLSSTMDVLSKTLGGTYTIKEDTVTISGATCQ
jgi:ferric-dicitrate binding protein FerR (iron transport regulator)